jgi:hypothetical protein
MNMKQLYEYYLEYRQLEYLIIGGTITNEQRKRLKELQPIVEEYRRRKTKTK